MQRVFLCITLVISSLAFLSLAEPAAERIDISGRPEANDLTRITIQIEAGGHNLVRTQDAEKGQTDQKLPMSVSAKLQYEERRLNPFTTGMKEGIPLAVRYYN